MKNRNELTYDEVATVLRCCRRTVNRLVADRILIPNRTGHRTVRFDRAEVLRVKPLLKLKESPKKLLLRVITSERNGR